jgi:hypothetical protein
MNPLKRVFAKLKHFLRKLPPESSKLASQSERFCSASRLSNAQATWQTQDMDEPYFITPGPLVEFTLPPPGG